MEDGRTQTDHGGGDEHGIIIGGEREGGQPGEGEAHANDQGIRFGVMIGVIAHDGLKDRPDHLKRERDQANLREREVERNFQQRVNRRNKRLHGIVKQMAGTQGNQDAEGRIANGRRGRWHRYGLTLSIHGGAGKKKPCFVLEAGRKRFGGLILFALLTGMAGYNNRQTFVHDEANGAKGDRPESPANGVGFWQGQIVGQQRCAEKLMSS